MSVTGTALILKSVFTPHYQNAWTHTANYRVGCFWNGVEAVLTAVTPGVAWTQYWNKNDLSVHSIDPEEWLIYITAHRCSCAYSLLQAFQSNPAWADWKSGEPLLCFKEFVHSFTTSIAPLMPFIKLSRSQPKCEKCRYSRGRAFGYEKWLYRALLGRFFPSFTNYRWLHFSANPI